jgi:hypothetical protein
MTPDRRDSENGHCEAAKRPKQSRRPDRFGPCNSQLGVF